MSALSADWFSAQIAVATTVVTTSLLGSAHCAGMCGGLVIATTEGRTLDQILYHLGRGVSYTLLGLIAGFASSRIYTLPSTSNSTIRTVQIVMTSAVALYFIVLGVRRIWSPNASVKIPKMLARFFDPILDLALRFRKWPGGSFIVGIVTALLPCGWLYSFVLAAFLTQSMALGALTMFAFWIGTVPILAIVGTGASLTKNLGMKLWKNQMPRITGVLFIALGLASMAIHTRPLFKKAPPAHGHTHSSDDTSCH